MSEALSYILLATSIFLFLLLIQLSKRKKALERELLILSKQDEKPNIEEELRQLRENALREIDQLKILEKNRLDEELRQKRLENDAEITSKQLVIDKILEDYKKSQEEALSLTISAERNAALELFTEQKEVYENELFFIQGQLALERAKIEQLRRNQIEITEALMREALKREEYHLNFTDADRMEVEDLQTVAFKYPRIRPVILKAIYEIYYAPEVKKLIARVVGKEKISGIYRITSRLDGRTYVGKAVDIATRWQTHFKRAAGVETETTNLLYPAMRQDGLDQFSFEILERVEDEEKLREREQYWQEFYDAKSHGFSVK